MSETPLTDEQTYQVWSEGNQGLGDEYAENVVPAEFARGLEIQLKLLRERHERLESVHKTAMEMWRQETISEVRNEQSTFTIGQ